MISQKKLFTILFVLFNFSMIRSANINCNCVAFRLDDIQDYWITKSQKAVMDVFKANKDPLSVGVISGAFGDDATNIVNYVKDAIRLPGWDFEVVSHGFRHENYDQKSLEVQTTELAQSKSKTVADLGGLIDDIDIFIPPFNTYNQDTLTALKTNGYKMMSSLTFIDPAPYSNQADPDFYKFPIGCSTNDMNNQIDPVSWELTFSQIQNQMNSMGFAAVMMHPQEFSVHNEFQVPQEEVNTTHIAQLVKLVDAVKAAGYRIVTLGGLADAFDAIAATTTETVSSSTSSSSSVSSGSSTSTSETLDLTTSAVTTKSVPTPVPSTTGALTTSVLPEPEPTPITTGVTVPTVPEPEPTPITTADVVPPQPATTGATEITTSMNGGSPPSTPEATTGGLKYDDPIESSSSSIKFSSFLLILISISMYLL